MKEDNKEKYWEILFQNAPYFIFKNAKNLRKRTTNAEDILWKHIRNRKIDGYKFRRQHPFDEYILDFYCPEKKLAIELDGAIHNNEEARTHDIAREGELLNKGVKAIRFTNHQVEYNIEFVLKTITSELNKL